MEKHGASALIKPTCLSIVKEKKTTSGYAVIGT